METFSVEFTTRDGETGYWVVETSGNYLPVGPFEDRAEAVYYGESKGWGFA